MDVINSLLFLCGFKIELILKVKEKKEYFAFVYFLLFFCIFPISWCNTNRLLEDL